MPTLRSRRQITLTPGEREGLERMAAHRGGLSYLARRARIILLAAQGKSNREIHVLTGSSYQTVEVWRRRFSRVSKNRLRAAV